MAEVCDGLCTLKRSVPVIEFEAALRVGVAGAVAEGRVLEAIRLHPVELVVDVADEAGGVLQQDPLISRLKVSALSRLSRYFNIKVTQEKLK